MALVALVALITQVALVALRARVVFERLHEWPVDSYERGIRATIMMNLYAAASKDGIINVGTLVAWQTPVGGTLPAALHVIHLAFE